MNFQKNAIVAFYEEKKRQWFWPFWVKCYKPFQIITSHWLVSVWEID